VVMVTVRVRVRVRGDASRTGTLNAATRQSRVSCRIRLIFNHVSCIRLIADKHHCRLCYIHKYLYSLRAALH
jgi:hypothetical protein